MCLNLNIFKINKKKNCVKKNIKSISLFLLTSSYFKKMKF